jgi:hypothetical protein
MLEITEPDPVVVAFPFPRHVNPLLVIADTLDGHVEAGEPLSPSAMIALAATLRSLALRPVEPVSSQGVGVVLVPVFRGKLVPGSAREEWAP